MNRNEFLKQLENRLSSLPEAERSEVIRFYSDYIDDAEIDEGSVIEALGSPDEVAREVLESYGNKGDSDSGSESVKTSEYALLPFTTIEADLQNSTITINRGNVQNISIKNVDGNGEIHYFLEDGTLRIDQDPVKKFTWFKGLKTSHVTITLTGEQYDELYLKSVNGKITVSDIRVKEMNLESTNGGIELSSLNIGTLDMENVSGGIKMTDVHAKRSDIQAVNGSVTLDGCDCHALCVENVNGSIKASGNLSGTIDLSTVNGSIVLHAAKPAECFDWCVQTLCGSINLNGEKYTGTAQKRTGLHDIIRCETVNGSVVLNFKQ